MFRLLVLYAALGLVPTLEVALAHELLFKPPTKSAELLYCCV
jgi:hypothetical protein